MVTALIIAGGSGNRTKQAVPKQFLTVNDIQIIVFTMQNMQKVAAIDEILVVGPEGWENFIYSYATQFGVSKLKKVVVGGNTRHESIYNGLCNLEARNVTGKICICDGNRPMVPESVILDTLAMAEQCDCAICTAPCYDSMYLCEGDEALTGNIDRGILYKGSAPECAELSALLEVYRKANEDAITNLGTAGLFLHYNKKVLHTRASVKCFKITTAEDFDLFKALLNAEPLSNIVK